MLDNWFWYFSSKSLRLWCDKICIIQSVQNRVLSIWCPSFSNRISSLFEIYPKKVRRIAHWKIVAGLNSYLYLLPFSVSAILFQNYSLWIWFLKDQSLSLVSLCDSFWDSLYFILAWLWILYIVRDYERNNNCNSSIRWTLTPKVEADFSDIRCDKFFESCIRTLEICQTSLEYTARSQFLE